MDENELQQLKAEKSKAILTVKGAFNGKAVYEPGKCKEIAVMELRIAIAEIEHGQHLKALANMESAKRFIERIKM